MLRDEGQDGIDSSEDVVLEPIHASGGLEHNHGRFDGIDFKEEYSILDAFPGGWPTIYDFITTPITPQHCHRILNTPVY